jgi:hypothetical protein
MAALQKLSRSALRGEGSEQTTRMDAVRTAVERLPTRQAYVEELTRLWREAQDRFVAIGEYLTHAKETLPHGEYEKMVVSDLPFGRAVAHTLRTIALAVREGRLAKPELPRSYTTAYFLATLKPDQLAMAREQGLVRHDVPRSIIEAFRRDLRRLPVNDAYLELSRERSRLRTQLATIRARLTEIDHQIGPEAQVLEAEVEHEPALTPENTTLTPPADLISKPRAKQQSASPTEGEHSSCVQSKLHQSKKRIAQR